MEWLRGLSLDALLETLPEPLLRLQEALLTVLRSPLLTVVAVVLGLVALMVLMLVYAVAWRLWNERQQRFADQRVRRWSRLVPQYLDDMVGLAVLVDAVPPAALMQFGNYLQPYLMDLAGEEKQRLVNVLYEVGFERELRLKARSKSEWQRASAANFFSLMQEDAAQPLLRKMVQDRSSVVRFAAAQALMRMQDRQSVEIVLRTEGLMGEKEQERLAVLLMEFGPDILPELTRLLALRHLPAHTQVQMLRILELHAGAEATWETLTLVNETPHQEVRIAGIRALASFQEPTLSWFFESLLTSENETERAMAAKGLGAIGDGQFIPTLCTHLEDSDFWVRKQIAEALVSLGPAGLEALHTERNRLGADAPTAILLDEVLGQQSPPATGATA